MLCLNLPDMHLNDQNESRFIAAGKLVTLRGTVVRASGIKPLVRRLGFLCPKCGCEFTEDFQDGFYKLPSACQGDGCRGKYFLPQKSTVRTVDWQKIRLQV